MDENGDVPKFEIQVKPQTSKRLWWLPSNSVGSKAYSFVTFLVLGIVAALLIEVTLGPDSLGLLKADGRFLFVAILLNTAFWFLGGGFILVIIYCLLFWLATKKLKVHTWLAGWLSWFISFVVLMLVPLILTPRN